jgi:chemotaxis protein MotB
MKNLFTFLMLVILGTSCVSTKKFDKLTAQKIDIERERDSLRNEKNRLYEEIRATNNRVEDGNNNISTLQRQIKGLNATNQDLNARYTQLLNQNQNLQQSATSERQSLNERLAAQQLALEQREKQLRQSEMIVKQRELDFNSAQGSLTEKDKKLNELTALLKNQEQSTAALRAQVNKALTGFAATDITVREQNGKIYVSLSQDLLFAAGKSELDGQGKDALRKLAQALATSDTDILVEGHTDSDGDANVNWDLSVSRATAVTKVLTSAGIKPERVTAAGRSRFVPIAPNTTPAGKAKNRRTEIILSPKLDELYKIINNK